MAKLPMLIEAEDLKGLMGSRSSLPKLRIFDASVMFSAGKQDPDAFAVYQQSHVSSAGFFDHRLVSDSSQPYMFMVPGPQKLASALGKLGIADDSLVVFYSTQNISWATRAWWLLHYLGHEQVAVLNGGYSAWLQAGGAVTGGLDEYPATRYDVTAVRDVFATAEDLQYSLEQGSVCLVNTLPASFYRGDVPEVAYAKDGHITGSVSHPSDSLLENGAFPDPVLLAQKLNDQPGKSDQSVVTYCGGGIAATVNAFAWKLMGREDVKVYDGSLSEWLGRNLPTTTGSDPGSWERST